MESTRLFQWCIRPDRCEIAHNLPELHGSEAATVEDMVQDEFLITAVSIVRDRILPFPVNCGDKGVFYTPVTPLVIVDSLDTACDLVQAYIIEAIEASAMQLPNPMIFHKELLLPTHEYMISLEEVCH